MKDLKDLIDLNGNGEIDPEELFVALETFWAQDEDAYDEGYDDVDEEEDYDEERYEEDDDYEYGGDDAMDEFVEDW